MIPRAKKHLGQNFLIDGRIQQKIIQACDLKADDIIVEIGPGQGALTRLMASDVKRLIAVETDRDLIESLCSNLPSVEIVHADFLKWDMGHLPDGIKVIGNIPYYISTPIIEKLIENRKRISTAFLTVQLEFAERLAAKPGGKDYGSLTCFVQYYMDVKVLFRIKNTCFRPSPKVDSCCVRLDMKHQLQDVDEKFLFKLIQTAFQQRRKTIINSLKGMVDKEMLGKALADLGIKSNARPEQLTLSNYIELCKCLVL
ncbi:MAG: ribosomal RNA small subunit methyltransferase A [Candidatus Omnitrophica bacterium]|nr:ribosomal RNA small subunit methyltransferase A [Candidatus Omnitrophota bacterium]MDE2223004.1 ribosomal RNA small subunit methyltransferase A [Candidatus Omnitrophota bacterium]